MKRLFCVICRNYRKFEKPKIPYLSEKAPVLSIISSKCKNKDENISKGEESTEILKILGLMSNIKEYQKIHNYVRRKHES